MDPPTSRNNVDSSQQHQQQYQQHQQQQRGLSSGDRYPSTSSSSFNNPSTTSSKRRAQVGQWTTPPHPIFPSIGSSTTSNTTNNSTNKQEYNVALHDAYRRGAEVAAAQAAVASNQHQQQVTAQQQAFYAGFLAAQQQTSSCSEHGIAGDEATSALSTNHLHESCPNFLNLPAHNAPPPIPQIFPQTQQQPQSPVTAVPYNYFPHLQPPIHISSHQHTAHSTVPPELLIPASNRSTSLPNISSYAARATHQEDEKRSKRLVRNRASARMRRLKKKNLVESYEGELKLLSSSLEKLQVHNWGDDDNNNKNVNHDALLEALSMDRGGQQQSTWSAEERNESIKDILKQQCEQVDSLLDVQTEFMILSLFMQQQHGPANNENDDKLSNEEKELCTELEQVLQLTDTQKLQLNQSLSGVNNEYTSLTTIKQCLHSLIENEYLVNPAVDDQINELMSIFHPTQLSKFLLWTDHNSDSVDQLDYVNPTRDADSAMPVFGPKFIFGIDNEGAIGHIDD